MEESYFSTCANEIGQKFVEIATATLFPIRFKIKSQTINELSPKNYDLMNILSSLSRSLWDL